MILKIVARDKKISKYLLSRIKRYKEFKPSIKFTEIDFGNLQKLCDKTLLLDIDDQRVLRDKKFWYLLQQTRKLKLNIIIPFTEYGVRILPAKEIDYMITHTLMEIHSTPNDTNARIHFAMGSNVFVLVNLATKELVYWYLPAKELNEQD